MYKRAGGTYDSKGRLISRRKTPARRRLTYERRVTAAAGGAGGPGRIVGRSFGSVLGNDSSIRTLNAAKNLPYFCSRSATFNSFSVSPSTGGAGQIYNFDPSGTYGSGFGNQTMRDWSSFAGIFDQYCVKKIRVTFSLSDTAAGPGTSLKLYCRYNYDLNFGTPTLSSLSDLSMIQEKTFTETAPDFTYTIYPKVSVTEVNSGVLASQGRKIQNMGWVDVNAPVQLMGIVYWLASTDSTQTVFMNVEYEIGFRYNT